VVGEIMTELEAPEWTEEERNQRWFETWFMIMGSVVDFNL